MKKIIFIKNPETVHIDKIHTGRYTYGMQCSSYKHKYVFLTNQEKWYTVGFCGLHKITTPTLRQYIDEMNNKGFDFFQFENNKDAFNWLVEKEN